MRDKAPPADRASLRSITASSAIFSATSRQKRRSVRDLIKLRSDLMTKLLHRKDKHVLVHLLVQIVRPAR